jgi:hypothetical protein
MAKRKAVGEIERAINVIQPLADMAARHYADTGSNAAENLMGCLDTALEELKQASEFYAVDFDTQNPKD